MGHYQLISCNVFAHDGDVGLGGVEIMSVVVAPRFGYGLSVSPCGSIGVGGYGFRFACFRNRDLQLLGVLCFHGFSHEAFAFAFSQNCSRRHITSLVGYGRLLKFVVLDTLAVCYGVRVCLDHLAYNFGKCASFKMCGSSDCSSAFTSHLIVDNDLCDLALGVA